MKVVVTGASGNVGTALLRALSGDRCDIVGIARRIPEIACEPYAAARWVRCDVGAADAVEILRAAFAGADVLVHLAWAIHPRRDDPPMRRTNLDGSTNVLRAAAQTGVPHIIAASSVAAYTPAGRWDRVSEEWTLSGVPGSAYSLGKVELEKQLDSFAVSRPSVRVARVRPCGIVQAEASAELADWILPPWLPRGILGRSLLPVPVWPGFRLQVIHSADVAAAIRLIMRHQAAGAFNLAAEPLLRADTIADTFGGPGLPMPRRALGAAAWFGWRTGIQPLHPAWLVLADRACLVDTANARRDLGWTPRLRADEVCADLVEALRAGKAGHSPPLAPARSRIRVGRPSHQSQCPAPQV